jgi:lactate dehydrogenase-like 2-hydroxyacid dehydrogenase
MTKKKPLVVVTRRLPELVETRMRELFDARLNIEDKPMSQAEIVETMREADVLVPTITDQINAAMIAQAGDQMRLIANFGNGVDHIDVTSALRRGITVTNTPGVLTEDTADMTMALILSTARRLVEGSRVIPEGQWTGWSPTWMLGRRITGKRLGIVGMGRIGQAIGRRLEASLVPVSYHSRNPAAGVSYKHYPDLIEMAKAVDTLVVIVPGGASTAKMINADVLKALGQRGVLVNVARGSVVDEPALIAALKSGTILAAGLDVFAAEPNVPDELKAMQNVVLLPHIGSASVVTRNAMDQLVVDNIKTWFAGKPPLTPVAETPVKGR